MGTAADTPAGAMRRVAARVEAVWALLTDRRAEWWPELEFAAAPGAPVLETWHEGGAERTAHGVVIEVRPPSRLALAWRQEGWTGDTRVDIELRAEGAETLVAVTESGFRDAGAAPDEAADHTEGWSWHLARLAEAAERAD